jgi:dTDP-4-dehydrorhamnose reductase
MRILITGAYGLLGSNLSRYLSGKGYEVLMHGKSSGELAGDLININIGFQLLKKTRPNIIINLAALTDVEECEKNPSLAFQVNSLIVQNLCTNINLLENLLGYQILLIQISTDQVYCGSGPHIENNVLLKNYYAYSKYIGEIAAINIGGIVLRTNFFGKSERLNRSSFSDWVFNKLKLGEKVYAYKDIRFSPLSIPTLNNAIERVIKNPVSGLYNIGSNNGMSKADFIFYFAECSGLPKEKICSTLSTKHKQIAFRPNDMRMVSEKFSKTFLFPIPDLRDQIKMIASSYINK